MRLEPGAARPSTRVASRLLTSYGNEPPELPHMVHRSACALNHLNVSRSVGIHDFGLKSTQKRSFSRPNKPQTASAMTWLRNARV